MGLFMVGGHVISRTELIESGNIILFYISLYCTVGHSHKPAMHDPSLDLKEEQASIILATSVDLARYKRLVPRCDVTTYMFAQCDNES